MRSPLIFASLLAISSGAARADLLDPRAFTPITIPNGTAFTAYATSSGAYLQDVQTNKTYAGVISNGIAVFDVVPGTKIVDVYTTGNLPVAFLSTGNLTLGTVTYDAQTGIPSGNGDGFYGQGQGGGASGGTGGAVAPGRMGTPGGVGGDGAGGLLFNLNAGANGVRSAESFGGGQGAGAIEAVSLATLTVGSISARGQVGAQAQGNYYGGGGGGGGGGIILSGNALSITGTLDVSGGAGGHIGIGGGGGGGGGGEIDLLWGAGGYNNGGTFNVSGGAGGGGNSGGNPAFGANGNPGQDGGVVTFGVVPEPSSAVLFGLGLAAGVGAVRRARQRGRLID